MFILNLTFSSKEDDYFYRKFIKDSKEISEKEAYRLAFELYLKSFLEDAFSKEPDEFTITELVDALDQKDTSERGIVIGKNNDDTYYASIIRGKKSKKIVEVVVYENNFNKWYAYYLNVEIVDISEKYKAYMRLSREELILKLILKD